MAKKKAALGFLKRTVRSVGFVSLPSPERAEALTRIGLLLLEKRGHREEAQLSLFRAAMVTPDSPHRESLWQYMNLLRQSKFQTYFSTEERDYAPALGEKAEQMGVLPGCKASRRGVCAHCAAVGPHCGWCVSEERCMSISGGHCRLAKPTRECPSLYLEEEFKSFNRPCHRQEDSNAPVGHCCGDGVCGGGLEDAFSCPSDCAKRDTHHAPPAPQLFRKHKTQLKAQSDTTLFGSLQTVVTHDVYHCAQDYQELAASDPGGDLRDTAADWLRFDHNASCLVRLHRRVQQGLLEFSLPGPDQGEALDLGCGAGPDTRYIASMGYNTTGVDVSPIAVRLAQRKLSEFGFLPYQRVEFLAYDAMQLPKATKPLSFLFDGTVNTSSPAPPRPKNPTCPDER